MNIAENILPICLIHFLGMTKRQRKWLCISTLDGYEFAPNIYWTIRSGHVTYIHSFWAVRPLGPVLTRWLSMHSLDGIQTMTGKFPAWPAMLVLIVTDLVEQKWKWKQHIKFKLVLGIPKQKKQDGDFKKCLHKTKMFCESALSLMIKQFICVFFVYQRKPPCQPYMYWYVFCQLMLHSQGAQ